MIERGQDCPIVLGVPWNKLPIRFRRRWWAYYGLHPKPSTLPKQHDAHVQAWLNRSDGWRTTHAAERALQETEDLKIMGARRVDRDPDFEERMPELLAADLAKAAVKQRQIKDDCEQGREVWQGAEHRPPCAACLRMPLCQQRCLRSMLPAEAGE